MDFLSCGFSESPKFYNCIYLKKLYEKENNRVTNVGTKLDSSATY